MEEELWKFFDKTLAIIPFREEESAIGKDEFETDSDEKEENFMKEEKEGEIVCESEELEEEHLLCAEPKE
ncbi:unnamed protein product [Cylicocyclus nassatus]|uniref:Uncharacterized protein n=1 Tax=Cylicocyclus nassatus TaxID=53992 RepID=A0AA36DNX7_CYLNA|nr:unnamed protein product [Cylicocyclus nassatus]